MDIYTEETAIRLIQRLWRGQLARKKYGIIPALATDLTDERAFLVGNDPRISELEVHATSEKAVLIGTSGLRSLALLCALGATAQVRKLIIVDNSRKVVELWRLLRLMVEQSEFVNTEDFLGAFAELLARNRSLFHQQEAGAYYHYNTAASTYENQNPVLLLQRLCHHYGLASVLVIIRHSSIFAQSWANTQFFTALKNIMDLQEVRHIYTYPSNIYYCVSREDALKVISNVRHLAPVLSIETDCCPLHHIPEQVLLSSFDGPEVFAPTPWQRQALAIKEILGEFKFKLIALESHPGWVYTEVQQVYDRLEHERIKAFFPPSYARIRQFLLNTRIIADNAVSRLQNDLEWPDYLRNLIKRVANMLTSILTLGYSSGFFASSYSSSALLVSDLNAEIGQQFCVHPSPLMGLN